MRTKTKNVITGSVVETSYNPTAKFPQAFIERKEVTYSYEDGDLYHFMDVETYDDIPRWRCRCARQLQVLQGERYLQAAEL